MQDDLDKVAVDVRRCRLCSLWRGRLRAVPGEGPESAECMLIGESPGAEEDRLGRPFVGRSGRYLDETLARRGLERETLFITGSVKCHPPRNRDPTRGELASCRTYLDRQIEIIDPKLIVLLGRVAVQGFLGSTKLEGVRGRLTTGLGRAFLATYHPSAAMRFPSKREPFEADMRKIARILAASD